jgi:hypothetical protein
MRDALLFKCYRSSSWVGGSARKYRMSASQDVKSSRCPVARFCKVRCQLWPQRFTRNKKRLLTRYMAAIIGHLVLLECYDA